LIFEKILKLANEKGMSISELERLSGLSKGAISKWKTSSPTVENLQAVAKVLKVPIKKLLE
jgi:transcriptional regulator with XRE-family HTH domain